MGARIFISESWSQPHKYIFLKPIIYFWYNQGTHAFALIIKFKLNTYFLSNQSIPWLQLHHLFFGVAFGLLRIVCVWCVHVYPMTKTVSPQGGSVFASTVLRWGARFTFYMGSGHLNSALHAFLISNKTPHDRNPLHWFLQKIDTITHYEIQALFAI